MQDHNALKDVLDQTEARVKTSEAQRDEEQNAHAAAMLEAKITFEAKLHNCSERSQMKIEDLRAAFLLFTEKHSKSDAEHDEEVCSLRKRLEGVNEELHAKSEMLQQQAVAMKEGAAKFKKMMAKGKVTLAAKETKLKKGMQLVKSLQSKKKKME